MNKRKLGRTGLAVSEVSFGAWQLGNNQDWGGMDDKTAHELIAEAIEKGINLFDTAPNYAAGRSEILLGETLQGKRDQIVLVSKFGHHPGGKQDYTVEAFWESLHGSLNRLQTHYIDVLLIHNPPAHFYQGQDPIWEALEEARQQGKINHYGASLDFADEAEACLDNTASDVLEVFFNILHQDIRQAFPLIKDKTTGILAKIPLDSGWLTGRFNSESCFEGVRQRWSENEIRQRAELISALDWLPDDDFNLTQKSLGYLLAYQEVSCVIPGIRNHKQLLENLRAVECGVSGRERARLEAFWDEFTNGGENLLPW